MGLDHEPGVNEFRFGVEALQTQDTWGLQLSPHPTRLRPDPEPQIESQTNLWSGNALLCHTGNRRLVHNRDQPAGPDCTHNQWHALLYNSHIALNSYWVPAGCNYCACPTTIHFYRFPARILYHLKGLSHLVQSCLLYRSCMSKDSARSTGHVDNFFSQ